MLTERVVWTEGLQLSPVHFQQQDRYTDSQMSQRSLLLSHYGWGFTEFAIDEQYLNLGKVVLSKAQGILPDGSLFEIGHGQEGLSLDVEPGTMRLCWRFPLRWKARPKSAMKKIWACPPAMWHMPSQYVPI